MDCQPLTQILLELPRVLQDNQGTQIPSMKHSPIKIKNEKPEEHNIKTKNRITEGPANMCEPSTMQSASGLPPMNTLSASYNLPHQAPSVGHPDTIKPESTTTAAILGRPMLQ